MTPKKRSLIPYLAGDIVDQQGWNIAEDIADPQVGKKAEHLAADFAVEDFSDQQFGQRYEQ